MKQTGRCPKCQSSRIVRAEKRKTLSDMMAYLPFFKPIPYTQYICLQCGYMEHWLDSYELDKVNAQYNKQINSKKINFPKVRQGLGLTTYHYHRHKNQ